MTMFAPRLNRPLFTLPVLLCSNLGSVLSAADSRRSRNNSRLRIHCYSRPAGSFSGDFSLVKKLPDGRTAVVLGDAIGHGLTASVLSLCARLIFLRCMRKHSTASAVMTAANRALMRILKDGAYVTAVMVILDPASGRVTWCGAGHPGVLLYKAGPGPRRSQRLTSDNIVLGLIDRGSLLEQNCELPSGDRLYMVTDGILEARNSKSCMFGPRRIHKFFLRNRTSSARTICRALLEKVSHFESKDEPPDDKSLVAIEVC